LIAVTGATGTVGRELVRLLVERGHRPRVITRDVAVARLVFGADVGYAQADLDRPETLPAALAGAEQVFLLSPATARQPVRERQLVAAAAKAGVGHVVKTSVYRANPSSRLRLARQHGQVEKAITRSSLQWTFLRPAFFMQNLIGQILNGVVCTAAEDGRVGMIDARDVAAAAAAVLTSPSHVGRSYTLTGPRAVTFDQVAEAVRSAGGHGCTHRRSAPEQVRVAMLHAGAESWFAFDMARLHTMLAAGYEDVVTGDLHQLTGDQGRDITAFVQDMLPTPQNLSASR
jgi:uncharacterized protein YbjT (DUF2867 family)